MFNRSNFIKKYLKGSTALAWVLIVGGIAGVTTVGMGYLALKDSEINSKMEDSQTAYQAASAGIKLGRLYNHYKRDNEMSSQCLDNTITNIINPAGNYTVNCAKAPTSDPNDTAIRIYLNRLGCSKASLSQNDPQNNPKGGTCVSMPQDPASPNPNTRKTLSGNQLGDSSNPKMPYWKQIANSTDFSNIPTNEEVVDLTHDT